MAAKAPLAARYILEAVGGELEVSPQDGFALKAALFGRTMATDDMGEGTRVFLEKRKPEFKGT